MGQPVRVVDKRVLTAPDVVRYEVDRSLTGSGHEAYFGAADAISERPPDQLARRLFDTGFVTKVHVFSNLITVTLKHDSTGQDVESMQALIEELFIHYTPGVEPTPV